MFNQIQYGVIWYDRVTKYPLFYTFNIYFFPIMQFKPDPRFEEAKQFIRSGAFGSYDYNPLLDSLEGDSGYGRGDYFLVGQDFPSYIDAQAKVDEAYK